MKNALHNQVGMLGVIYLVKQACGNNILASVYIVSKYLCLVNAYQLQTDVFCSILIEISMEIKNKGGKNIWGQ